MNKTVIFYLLHSSLHRFLILFIFNYITISCIYLFLTPNSRSVIKHHSFIHSRSQQNVNVNPNVACPVSQTLFYPNTQNNYSAVQQPQCYPPQQGGTL